MILERGYLEWMLVRDFDELSGDVYRIRKEFLFSVERRVIHRLRDEITDHLLWMIYKSRLVCGTRLIESSFVDDIQE